MMAKYETTRLIDSRLHERDASAAKPVFVGLLNPNSQGGVFINSAPATSYEDTDRDSILNYLAVNLYGGGGGHSIFMKTAGAGLAYQQWHRHQPFPGTSPLLRRAHAGVAADNAICN
jgi:hypothetical protein